MTTQRPIIRNFRMVLTSYVIEQKAELFAAQRWTPGCGACGAMADQEMSPSEAAAWTAAHRQECVG